MRRPFALLCALLCACSDPPRAPATGHTYSVAFVVGSDGTGWQPWQRTALEQALVALGETGDRFVLAADVASADLVVSTYANTGCSTLHGDAGAGGYALGTRRMRLDPACVAVGVSSRGHALAALGPRAVGRPRVRAPR